MQYPWAIESEALQTGLIAIDSSIPIGCGQRELIVGDRQTGKTSISIDSILNQKYSTIFTVYTSLGQSSSSILQVFLSLVQKDAIFLPLNAHGHSQLSAVHQYLCAYREIYLLLRRPAGREAYPGEIFFVHSRLLERSAKLSYNH